MELKTQIAEVTVFTDRARLTRRGAHVFEAGGETLEINGLPPGLDPSSVRASARGQAGATILGVDVKPTFFAESPAEEIRALEGKLEKAKDESENLEAALRLLQQEREGLEKLSNESRIFAVALSKGQMSLEDQFKLLDSTRARADAISVSRTQLKADQRVLQRLIAKLERELAALRGGGERQRFSAEIAFDVSRAGELEVDLTYDVFDASWQPLYDLRLMDAEGESSLEVGYLALVSQRTGEAWEEVELTLSTARPALAGTVPELDPWYLRPLHAPRPLRKARAMQMAAPSQALAAEAGAPAEDFEAETLLNDVERATSEIEFSGGAVSFKVPGKVTIPPDSTQRKVTVAHLPFKPEIDYVSAPKLVEAVYRRAKVVNQSDTVLLPGAANIFVEDAFIGTSRLELTPPKGEMEVYLGIDDRLRVEREMVRREVDKRLVGNKRRYAYGFEIKIENHLQREARVTIEDQLPIPSHENILVSAERFDPKPDEQTEMGLLRWSLAMKPGEKKTVHFEFRVEHPPDMEVAGLT